MTRRRFYLFSLTFPLLLPAICWAIWLFVTNILPLIGGIGTGHYPILGLLMILVAILIFSPVLAGIQYAIFASVAYYWLRSRSTRYIAYSPWLLPLLFAPFSMTLMTGFFFLRHNAMDKLSDILGMTYLHLIIGYFYVLLTYLLAWLGTKAGWIKESSDHAQT
jgi:hypothetical protein